MPNRGKMCGMICERKSDKFAFCVWCNGNCSEPGLAVASFLHCFWSSWARHAYPPLHMVALGCQMWKTKRVPDPYGSWQKTFSKDEVWQTDFARPLQCYSVFFFIQPCLRPWNSDCSWSPCSWHSFPATKLNTGTIYSLSFYQEVNTFRWNGKKKCDRSGKRNSTFIEPDLLLNPLHICKVNWYLSLLSPWKDGLCMTRAGCCALKPYIKVTCPMPLNRTYLTSLQP